MPDWRPTKCRCGKKMQQPFFLFFWKPTKWKCDACQDKHIDEIIDAVMKRKQREKE